MRKGVCARTADISSGFRSMRQIAAFFVEVKRYHDMLTHGVA